jgi:hypothetical protein
VTIEWSKVPLLAGVAEMAKDGFVTGASGRNWAGYGVEAVLDPSLPAVARDLLSDPQTSGGLLVSCDPKSAGRCPSLSFAARLRRSGRDRLGARRRRASGRALSGGTSPRAAVCGSEAGWKALAKSRCEGTVHGRPRLQAISW